MGVAADAAGNVYFTEFLGNRVRMVSASTSVVSTIAGTGVAGCSGDGGPAINAQLSEPAGITPEGSGGLYVVDFGCKSVRRITPDGVIQTVSDTLAFDAAVDQNGDLFVSQVFGTIVRISPNGQTIPIAGAGLPDGGAGDGGPAVNARVGANSLAVDPAGNLYIADGVTKSIRVVDSSGTIREYANLYASRIATDAAGNLYAIGNAAGDPGDMETNSQVYRVQQGGIVPLDGLANITALTADAENELYLARQRSDQSPLQANSQIRRVTVSRQASREPPGDPPKGPPWRFPAHLLPPIVRRVRRDPLSSQRRQCSRARIRASGRQPSRGDLRRSDQADRRAYYGSSVGSCD
jgi:hypothetical protein